MNRKLVLATLAMASALVTGLDGADKAPLSDDTLNDKVKLKLASDNIVKGGGLGIDVKNGVVTLTGKVETEKQKSKAEKLAHKVAGVKSVSNQIVVSHK
jgi:hyperosmotically inducible protein